MNQAPTSLLSLTVGPAQVLRGSQALELSGEAIARLGHRPLIVGGDSLRERFGGLPPASLTLRSSLGSADASRSLAALGSQLQSVLEQQQLLYSLVSYTPDCSEASLASLRKAAASHEADHAC